MCHGVKASESQWTIDDGVLELVLQKTKKHESWNSLIKGEHVIDPAMKDKMDKQMMLEKFQNEVGDAARVDRNALGRCAH